MDGRKAATGPFITETRNLLEGAFGLQICSIVADGGWEASSLDSCLSTVDGIRVGIQRRFECVILEDSVLLVPWLT